MINIHHVLNPTVVSNASEITSVYNWSLKLRINVMRTQQCIFKIDFNFLYLLISAVYQKPTNIKARSLQY